MPEEKTRVIIRFLGIMQKYSKGQRESEVEIPKNLLMGIEFVLEKYKIPWKDNLERSNNIFINKEHISSFQKKRKDFQPGDIVMFIPISGGG